MDVTHKYILLTGVTEPLAKVVLAELVRQHERHCILEIMVLMRCEGGKTPGDQFRKMAVSSDCFRHLKGGWMNIVQPFQGDVLDKGCGLGNKDTKKILQAVTHIIHADVPSELACEDSTCIDIHLTQAKHVLELAHGCKQLQRLIYTSTAYVAAPTTAPIQEVRIQLPRSPEEIRAKLVKGTLSGERILKKTGHKTLHNLTKCLVECFLMSQAGVHLSLVRHSLLDKARLFPAGWMEGETPLQALQSGICSDLIPTAPNKVLVDAVPVDEVARCLIHETEDAKPDAGEEGRCRIVLCVSTKERAMALPCGDGWPLGTYRWVLALCRMVVQGRQERQKWRWQRSVLATYAQHTFDFQPRDTKW